MTTRTNKLLTLAGLSIASFAGGTAGASLDLLGEPPPESTAAVWGTPTSQADLGGSPTLTTADEVVSKYDDSSSTILVGENHSVGCFNCSEEDVDFVRHVVWDENFPGPYSPIPVAADNVCYIGGPDDWAYLDKGHFEHLYEAAKWSCQVAPTVFPVGSTELSLPTFPEGSDGEYIAMKQDTLRDLHDAAQFGIEHGPIKVVEGEGTICFGPSIDITVSGDK